MSSFVSQYPVIRALLKRYREHNIEYAAVAPFQTAFSVLFPASEGYAANMEQSVDRDRYRVDLFVQGFDFDNDTLYPVLVGEGKGGGRSANAVEDQVLQRAREAIDGHGLLGIFAFTWLGEDFRVWNVSAQTRELEPLDSDYPRGNRQAYIPLDSPEGERIVTLTDIMKESRPLRAAPVVPSQSIPAEFYYQANQPPESSTQDNTTTFDPSFSEYSQQSGNNPGDFQGQAMETDASFSGVPEPRPGAGPSQRAPRSEGRSKQVTIQKRLRGGYKFAWKNGEVVTEKSEWKAEGDVLKLKEKFEGYYVWGRKP